jgi:hypothetical protein
MGADKGKAGKPPQDPARRELLELRYEIEEDLAAGRISQADYDLCKRRIAQGLRDLARPAQGKVRITAIPKKVIDWDQFARVLIMAAEEQLRQKQGKPPLSAAELREREVQLAQSAQEAKAEEAERGRKKADAAKRRLRRRKPEQLRQETWDWLLDKQPEGPGDEPLGSLLYRLGITEHPELLRSTVIQLPDGEGGCA